MNQRRGNTVFKKRILFTLLAAVMLFALLACVLVSCKNENKGTRSACISATKRAVRLELKDSDCTFCPDSEFSVRELEDGGFKVKGSLVAKNSETGKKVTHYFTAIVRGESYGDITVIWG